MKTSKWYFEIRNNNHSQFTFKEKEERERNKTKQNHPSLFPADGVWALQCSKGTVKNAGSENFM